MRMPVSHVRLQTGNDRQTSARAEHIGHCCDRCGPAQAVGSPSRSSTATSGCLTEDATAPTPTACSPRPGGRKAAISRWTAQTMGPLYRDPIDQIERLSSILQEVLRPLCLKDRLKLTHEGRTRRGFKRVYRRWERGWDRPGGMSSAVANPRGTAAQDEASGSASASDQVPPAIAVEHEIPDEVYRASTPRHSSKRLLPSTPPWRAPTHH